MQLQRGFWEQMARRRFLRLSVGAGADVDYLEIREAKHVWVDAPSVPEIIDRSLHFVDDALRNKVGA